MNVLISSLACSSSIGSEALVAFRLIEALNRRHSTQVVTSAGMDVPQGSVQHQVDVRFRDPNDVAPMQLLRFESAQRRLFRRLLKTNCFNLIHRLTPAGCKESLLEVPDSVPLFVGPILKGKRPPREFDDVFRRGVPRAGFWGPTAARVGHGISRRFLERLSTQDALLNRADRILVGSNVTLHELPAHLQARARLITFAGVEHDVFTPPKKRDSPLPTLLFVGRLVPYKGLELLLRAAGKAIERCRFRVRIIGKASPGFRSFFRDLAAELKLDGAVEFVEHQPRQTLCDVYRAADIFCMPSIETYGMAILEAMSSGCAPLVADFNGPGEIVSSDVGIKIPLRNPDQFIEEYAEAIVRLVEDAELRVQLGERARQRVRRLHDWNQIQESLLAIYDEMSTERSASMQEYRRRLECTSK